MSATATYPTTLDVSQTPRVPLSRLVRVELRKLFDTRAGLWLMISIGALTALVLAIQVWVIAAEDLSVSHTDFLTGASTPMGILLPVLGVLIVTQEWSQRTGLVTFALEPRRGRLIAAKLATGLIVGVAAVAVALGLAVVANLALAGITGEAASWNASAGVVAGWLAAQVISLVLGFAFGTLLKNTPAAIVLVFAFMFILGGLLAAGAALMGWFADLQPWIDANKAQEPLLAGEVSGSDWAHLVTTSALWLGVPLTIGSWRLMRAEVK